MDVDVDDNIYRTGFGAIGLGSTRMGVVIGVFLLAGREAQGKQADEGAERTLQRQAQENPAARDISLMQQGNC